VTDGFQVTMSDLQTAAQEFRTEADAFSGTLPGNGPAPVDGGSWVINDALSTVLESIGLLHTQLTEVIKVDATSLEATYQEYRSAEETITRLVTAVTVPGKAG
jgi:hypothetical protein